MDHIAKPSLVANCTRAELICTVSGQDPVVGWTFHGEDAVELPSTSVDRDVQVWRLSIACATIRHSGTYVCTAHVRNNSNLIIRKEAVLQVYGKCDQVLHALALPLKKPCRLI